MKSTIGTASKTHITSRIDIRVVFGEKKNTVVSVRIFEKKDGTVVLRPIRPVTPEWDAARKHLLEKASGCFLGISGNGDLIAIPHVGMVLRFLWDEAKTIALGG
jgi:hypothetical protein